MFSVPHLPIHTPLVLRHSPLFHLTSRAHPVHAPFFLDCPPRASPRRHRLPAMAKGKTVLIKMLSEAGTGFFYVWRKNPKTCPRKLQARKHDPRVNAHVLFTETKLRK